MWEVRTEYPEALSSVRRKKHLVVNLPTPDIRQSFSTLFLLVPSVCIVPVFDLSSCVGSGARDNDNDDDDDGDSDDDGQEQSTRLSSELLGKQN